MTVSLSDLVVSQSDFVSIFSQTLLVCQCNLILSFSLPHFLSERQILSESLQHSFIFRLATKAIRFSLVWKPSTLGKEKNMNVESFYLWKSFKNLLWELDLKECESLFFLGLNTTWHKLKRKIIENTQTCWNKFCQHLIFTFLTPWTCPIPSRD